MDAERVGCDIFNRCKWGRLTTNEMERRKKHKTLEKKKTIKSTIVKTICITFVLGLSLCSLVYVAPVRTLYVPNRMRLDTCCKLH
jgi:hypothetical protein